MNRKEREQLVIFEKIKTNAISRTQGALQLNLTTRWVRKKYKRYEQDGALGLVHKTRNRISTKRWNNDEKELMIELLQNEWDDFGPTFTAEKLKELKGISVSKETVRKAMISHGLWKRKRKRTKHRKWRERKGAKGQLVQLDGSPHDWFEGRGPQCTLLVFIDDATSEILWLEFVPSEARIDVIKATKNYIQKHGRPHAFYVDFGSVFSVNTNNPERDKKSQWERIMADLSIEVKHAHSPQAKGRVERANATMQDRLIKEMRLAKISSIKQANTFFAQSDFIKKHNRKFAVTPAQSGDAHRPTHTYDLNSLFCLKEQRILANDYTIRFCKKLLQLDQQQQAVIRPKNSITVHTYLDGSLILSIRGIPLTFSEIQTKTDTKEKIFKQFKPRKVHKNSKRWVSAIPLLESRVKTALPAVEVKNRN